MEFINQDTNISDASRSKNPKVMEDCFVVPGTAFPVKQARDLDRIGAFMRQNDEPPLFRFEANFYHAQEGTETEDATEADGEHSRHSGPKEKKV